MKSILKSMVVLSVLFVTPADAISQDDKKTLQPDEQMRVVRVVDENNEPVAEATVEFTFELESANVTSPTTTVTTNVDGEARVAIPPQAERFRIVVKANGFGDVRKRQSPDGTSTIFLKHGRLIRLRAVDTEGRLLKDAVPLIQGSQSREFKPEADGTLTSPVLKPDQKLIRVACGQDDGPMLFSDLIDITKANVADDGVLQVVLRPGVRLEGRLDNKVPRPVQEGYVEVEIIEAEHHQIAYHGCKWNDFTLINPDGTFLFESLPGGGYAQVHALVDGYISKTPSIESTRKYLRDHNLLDEVKINELTEYAYARSIPPQLIMLDEPKVTMTVLCEPTTTCQFRLLDPNGEPIEGATVHFNPNGAYVGGSMFIPGTSGSSALVVNYDRWMRAHRPVGIFVTIVGQEDSSPHGQEWRRRSDWISQSFLRTKSDSEGRVHIRNLPTHGQESFQISARGWKLPVSPLHEDRDTEKSDDKDEYRYGVVELSSGETIEKTIFLERNRPVMDRELTVINHDGKPLRNVSLTVSEIRVGKKDWQMWSVPQFGTLPKGTTDDDGRLSLQVPTYIENVAVQRLRIAIDYKRNEGRRSPDNESDEDREPQFFLGASEVDIPTKPDNGIIMLSPDPERKYKKYQEGPYPGKAKYGRLDDLQPDATKLIKYPNLDVLKTLLAGTEIPHPVPIELLCDDRHFKYSRKRQYEAKIASDGTNRFAIIEARVRQRNGKLANTSNLEELPECAYVFDMKGTLIAALGGEIDLNDVKSPDKVAVVNLGPQDLWFVHVERSSKSDPYAERSRYYRISNPIVSSLSLSHGTNTCLATSGSQKETKWGMLTFHFPDPEDDELRSGHLLATTSDGINFFPSLLWDHDRKRFLGPMTLRDGHRPLYQIDVGRSAEFAEFSAKPRQMVVEGGEREGNDPQRCYFQWYSAVPAGHEALLKLTIPQRDGPPKVIERKLETGCQEIELRFHPSEDRMAGSLEISHNDLGNQIKLDFDLNEKIGDRDATCLPVLLTLHADESAQLINRSLKDLSKRMTFDVTLIAK